MNLSHGIMQGPYKLLQGASSAHSCVSRASGLGLAGSRWRHTTAAPSGDHMPATAAAGAALLACHLHRYGLRSGHSSASTAVVDVCHHDPHHCGSEQAQEALARKDARTVQLWRRHTECCLSRYVAGCIPTRASL